MRTLTAMVAMVAGLALVPSTLFGQSSYGGSGGERIELPLAEEIALARSAAPADVSGDARVLVFDGEGWRTEVEGSNGVTCYVARTWPESLEPHCFDSEGSATILQIHLRQAELRIAGHSNEEVDAIVAGEVLSGQLKLPARPAMSYMMSDAQVLYSDTGEFVGKWQPHLMIYYPNLTQDDVGGSGSLDGVAMSDPGTPLSTMVIVVPKAVTPDPVGEHRGN